MSRSLTIDGETEALIDAEVGAGRFIDAAEMIRAAVKAYIDDRDIEAAEIRRLCDEGRASGIVGTGDEVLDRIEARIRSRL